MNSIMTIEEKAKAYDEAIDKIADAVEAGTIEQGLAEWLFPELKENEDERARKAIIQFFELQDDNTTYSFISKKDILAWLEKQGKQKSANKNEEVDNLHNYLYGEQKPTDNVEPKFKVGDWVINTITKEVEQVIELTDCEYICSGHLIISYNEQHLLKSWTIQDAKDGDVLCYKDEVFILKNYVLFHKIVYHSCYDGEKFIPHSVYSLTKDDFNSVHPATKEQRDLLFKKMKEAGYEWDAEKKELSKIEQANVNWSREDEQNLNAALSYINDASLCRWLKDVIHVKYDKSAWSEEDINVINHLLAICAGAKRHRQFAGCSQEDITKYHTWLKLFKDRVQLQLTPEWSEDDEKTIHLACEFIRHHSRKEDSISGIDCIELVKRLKSIKPQSTWKPSDEQIMALRWVLNNIPYDSHKEEISGLLDQIKDL